MMHILIAPNAFKNSLPADEVAIAIKKGLEQSRLAFTCECFPVADGGDGTARLITSLSKGVFVETKVHDPFRRPITVSFGLIHDGATAVLDMATASGLGLLRTDELNPLQASTFGTGELIQAALSRGVKQIIMGVGGSATVDGGCGILEALGAKFFDSAGNSIQAIPENLLNLSLIDPSDMDKRLEECIILCDVSNSLLGEHGAARVFGPQKGASEKDVDKLERALSQFNSVTLKTTGINMASLRHGGAAGGVAAGLHAFTGATLVNGIDYFLNMTGFAQALEKADVIITGEGSLDLQTLEGKGPYGVAVWAKNKNIPVIALAGKVPVENNPEIQKYFDVCMPIGDTSSDIATAIANTADSLIRAAKEIGNLLHLGAGYNS